MVLLGTLKENWPLCTVRICHLIKKKKNVLDTALESLTYGVTERTVIKKGITVTHQANQIISCENTFGVFDVYSMEQI